MIPFFSWRNARECLAGALGIALLCWVGESFYKVSGTLAAPLWPSSGLALGLLLACGWRLFPAISLGTMTATTVFGDPHLFSLFGSVANTLESLTGWYLMTRVFNFSPGMTRVRDVLILILAGAPVGTLLSAVICTLGLVEVGIVKSSAIPLSALLFWTGNVLGILIFTPLTLRIADRLSRRDFLHFRRNDVLWPLCLYLIVIVGFGLPGTAHTGFIPLAYLSFPLLVWLSFSWKRDATLPLAVVTLLMTTFTATGHGPLLRSDPFATYAEMTIFIMVYGISSLLIIGAAEEREHHAALAVVIGRDAARNEAELLGIRSSLNPHFLFNSLNVIKALASENPKKAGEAVVSLSEILRTSLRATAKTTVPLSEELKLIRSYLDLQKMRMEELLAVDIREDEGLSGFPVPPMVLHQLVENAVKHSPAGLVRIGIDIRRDGEGLRFLVRNPGHSQSHQAGIGLDAIRTQLRALYGEKSHFGIVDDGQGEIVAEIRIPRISFEDSRSSSPPSGL